MKNWSSGIFRRVALVRTDVSEEPGASLQEPHVVTSQKTPFFVVYSCTVFLLQSLCIIFYGLFGVEMNSEVVNTSILDIW
jgi:hypothetical protein